MLTEVKFALHIQNTDHVRIIEENGPSTIEFRAPRILESEWLGDMVAHALVRRFKEIISLHLQQERDR